MDKKNSFGHSRPSSFALLKFGSVWMLRRDVHTSAERALAETALRALGLDPNDWRTRDKLIQALSPPVTGMLNYVSEVNRHKQDAKKKQKTKSRKTRCVQQFHWYCDDCARGGAVTVELPLSTLQLQEELEKDHAKSHPYSACPGNYFKVWRVTDLDSASSTSTTGAARKR